MDPDHQQYVSPLNTMSITVLCHCGGHPAFRWSGASSGWGLSTISREYRAEITRTETPLNTRGKPIENTEL